MVVQQFKYRFQVIIGSLHYIAIGQEDALRIGRILGLAFNELSYLVKSQAVVFQITIHSAECAAVMRASSNNLQDEAVRFGWRSELWVIGHILRFRIGVQRTRER